MGKQRTIDNYPSPSVHSKIESKSIATIRFVYRSKLTPDEEGNKARVCYRRI